MTSFVLIHRESVLGGVELVRTSRLARPLRFIHEAFTVCELARGSLSVRVDRTAFELSGAAIVLVEPRVPVLVVPSRAAPAACQTIIIPRELVARAAHGSGPAAKKIVPTVAGYRPLVGVVRAAASKIAGGSDGDARRAVLALAARIDNAAVDDIDAPTEPRPAWLRRVLDHVHEHVSDELSSASLAKHARLSRSHFARMFHALTGTTPLEYVTTVRVSRARELIARGLGCAEAAHAVGFYDQSHLNRHFRRVLGITPGELAASRARPEIRRSPSAPDWSLVDDPA